MVMKMPPAEKVYEAFTCLGDERIEMHEDYALVWSSDRKKEYRVEWRDNTYASTDNATYWQGYPGYPVIAVLMKQGKLPCDEEVNVSMKGIAWKALNDQHKRDYAAAAQEALRSVENADRVREEGKKINALLADLDIEIRRKLKKAG